MKVAAIVCARIRSRRLPAKVLANFWRGNLINHILYQAAKLPHVDRVILCKPEGSENFLLDWNVNRDTPKLEIFNGPEDNVYERMRLALEKYQPDAFYRITGDNPILDPDVAYKVWDYFNESGVDYATICGVPDGTAIELVSMPAFYKIKQFLCQMDVKEHPTTAFVANKDRFNISICGAPPKWARRYRMTIDEPNDLVMFHRLMKACGPDVTLAVAVNYLDQHPEIANINNHVQQLTRVTDYEPDEIQKN